MQSLFLHLRNCMRNNLHAYFARLRFLGRYEKQSIQRHRLLGYNLFFIAFERLLQAIALFYCLGVLTENMSVKDYGQLNYAMSLGGIFMALSLFAGAELILPKLSRYRYLRADILTTGFYLRLCYALLSLLAIYIYQLLTNNLSMDLFWICLGFCFANVIVEVPSILGCWLILQQKNTWFSSARLLGLFAKLATFFYLSVLGTAHHNQTGEYLSYTIFIMPYIAEGVVSVLAIVAAFIICKNQAQKNHQKFNEKNNEKFNEKINIKSLKIWGNFKPRIAKRLIKDGIWIGLSLTAFFILQRMDRIILEGKTNFQTLGVYGNAMMINDAWLNIGLNICSLLAPALIYCIQGSRQMQMLDLMRILKRCSLYLTIYSGVGILLTYIFAEKLIIWQFGANYADSIWVLQIAVCLAPLLLINQMYTFCWLHLKKYHIQFLAWLLPCLSMYFLNYLHFLQISNDAVVQMLFAWFISYILMWVGQHMYLGYLRRDY